jgi:signal transduction histidine kinase
MSTLIEELLGITRLQQGTEKYPLSKGDFSEFVSLTAEGFVPQDDRGIQFETDIDDGIVCSYNASLISRAIYNLLQNAYKYGRDNGFVRLSLRREGEMAVMSVSDNGIGIAPEDQDKIWQRFWQADSSRGAESGSGLGLAMVREIAELHGGSVSAESTEGRGSEFIFRIPATS